MNHWPNVYRCYPDSYRLLYQWQGGNLRPCTWILRPVSKTWQTSVVQWFIEYYTCTYYQYIIKYIDRIAVYLHPWRWFNPQLCIRNDLGCCYRYIVITVHCISDCIQHDEEQKSRTSNYGRIINSRNRKSLFRTFGRGFFYWLLKQIEAIRRSS